MHKSAYGYFTFNYNRCRVFPSILACNATSPCLVLLYFLSACLLLVQAPEFSDERHQRGHVVNRPGEGLLRRLRRNDKQPVSFPLLKKLQPPQLQLKVLINPFGWLNNATFQRIVSAVSEAVLATIQGTGPSSPPPSSSSAATELVEMPIVESGSALSQVTVPAPVAFVLHNVTGKANVIQVSTSSQPALPTFHSVNVPIDANVSPKIKTKIWTHEFIDFGILLRSGAGDTRYHLSFSSPHG